MRSRRFCGSDFVLCTLMHAQSPDEAPSNVTRHPVWHYCAQLSGGTTAVQVSAPTFETANHPISNIAVLLHADRVLTGEHGRGWTRGAFEWSFTVIPVESFWVRGNHHAGGFEALKGSWITSASPPIQPLFPSQLTWLCKAIAFPVLRLFPKASLAVCWSGSSVLLR